MCCEFDDIIVAGALGVAYGRCRSMCMSTSYAQNPILAFVVEAFFIGANFQYYSSVHFLQLTRSVKNNEIESCCRLSLIIVVMVNSVEVAGYRMELMELEPNELS